MKEMSFLICWLWLSLLWRHGETVSPSVMIPLYSVTFPLLQWEQTNFTPQSWRAERLWASGWSWVSSDIELVWRKFSSNLLLTSIIYKVSFPFISNFSSPPCFNRNCVIDWAYMTSRLSDWQIHYTGEHKNNISSFSALNKVFSWASIRLRGAIRTAI